MTMTRRKFLKDSSLLMSAAAVAPALGGFSKDVRAAENRIELLGSYWTIAGPTVPHEGREYSLFDFKDRVEMLGKVGFTGMGLWHADLDHILETYTLKEMKQILEYNGIDHLELEFLTDWFTEGELRKQSDIQREKFMRASEVLHPRHIKIGDFKGGEFEMSRLIDTFAGVCEDAAKVGTKIIYEMIPISMVKTVKDSLTMIEGANQPNGGFMLDSWHIVKTRTPYEEVAAIPKHILMGVELNDGYIDAPEGMSLVEETTEHRQLLGEGEFDLKGLIKAIRATGYDGVYGVEILNKDLKTWPLDKAVTRVYETTLPYLV